MAIRIIAVPGQPDAVGYVQVPGPSRLADLKGGGPYSDRHRWPGLPVLSYDGRQPLVNGRPIEPTAEFKAELGGAIEFAGQRVFGGEWIGHISTVSGLAHRSVQRDRVAEYGLPLPVLQLLAKACAHPSPRVVGYLMLAVSYEWKSATEGDDPSETLGRMTTSARDELAEQLKSVVGVALDHVDEIRAAVFAFRGDTKS